MRHGAAIIMWFLATILAISPDGAAGEQAPASLHLSLTRGGEDERRTALAYVESHRPGDLLPLLRGTVIDDWDMTRKEYALEALSCYPFRSVSWLWMELLGQSMSFPIKKRIIDFMAESDDRRVVPALVEELSSPFSTVRESAIRALSRLGDDRMFPHILNMAKNPDPIYRVYALEAIYHLYDRRMGYLIKDMLRDGNKSVRYYALKCVEQNNLIENMPGIRVIALSDPNWEVRIKCIEIVRKFRDAGSMHVLLRSLVDANKDIRMAAVRALLEFRAVAATISVSNQLAVEDDDEIKAVLIDTLIASRGGGGFRGIERILSSDTSVSLRVRAAMACGEIGDPRAVGLLLASMNDSDQRVRAEACNSLGVFKGNRAITVKLQEVVCLEKSLYVRLAALYSLSRIGDRSSMLPLFDQYAVETDPVLKEKLRIVVRGLMTR